MTKWKPLKTAPRDGTIVWLTIKAQRNDCGRLQTVLGWYDRTERKWMSDEYGDEIGRPFHWADYIIPKPPR
jgi:hypothetical protein